MSKINIILSLSFIVFLLPFLGLPQAFDDFLYALFGLTIFALAYLLRESLNNKNIKSNEKDSQLGDMEA